MLDLSPEGQNVDSDSLLQLAVNDSVLLIQ